MALRPLQARAGWELIVVGVLPGVMCLLSTFALCSVVMLLVPLGIYTAVLLTATLIATSAWTLLSGVFLSWICDLIQAYKERTNKEIEPPLCMQP